MTKHFRKKKKKISVNELKRRQQQGIEDMEMHTKNLGAIMQNPSAIGLNNIVSCYKESKWYDRDFTPGGSPDLIMTDGKLIYILEYKTNHNRGAEEKAEKQLKTIRDWFYEKGVEHDKMKLMVVYGFPKSFEVVYYTKEQLDKVRVQKYSNQKR